MIKKCQICGSEFEGGKKARYCLPCRKAIGSRTAKENNLCQIGGRSFSEKYKKPVIKVEPVKEPVCDRYCDGCVYMGKIHALTRCCNYLLLTDQRRPCPPGKGCTVKDTDKKAFKQRQKIAVERKIEYYEKRRNSRKRTAVCPVCGAQFECTQARRKYCSTACYELNRRRTWREYDKKRGKNENH